MCFGMEVVKISLPHRKFRHLANTGMTLQVTADLRCRKQRPVDLNASPRQKRTPLTMEREKASRRGHQKVRVGTVVEFDLC